MVLRSHPISCSIKIGTITAEEEQIQGEDLTPNLKFVWGDSSREAYNHHMNCEEVQGHLKRFYTNSHNDVDTALEELTCIMTDVAKTTMNLRDFSNQSQVSSQTGDINKHRLECFEVTEMCLCTRKKINATR